MSCYLRNYICMDMCKDHIGMYCVCILLLLCACGILVGGVLVYTCMSHIDSARRCSGCGDVGVLFYIYQL